MRYKEIFTIYPRKQKHVTVFYYQCYDSAGKRTCGHSTGKKTRTAARIYCMELYRKGRLVPGARPISFAEYAKDWWDPQTCKYLEWRQMQNPLAPSTIDHYKTSLDLHIKPCFGKMKLNTITPEHIQEWMLNLARQGYSNTSINVRFAALKVMLKEAVRLNLIHTNPAAQVKKLMPHNKEVRILTSEEVQKLFPPDWKQIWDTYEVYLLNKLAACTGMRVGEIIGLQVEHIHDDHLHVKAQYVSKYGLTPLKTKDSRDIPIAGQLRKELLALVDNKTKGFVFSNTDGNEPISRTKIYHETARAFDRIGIDNTERKRRGLAVQHHWRHFLNTALLKANINTLKIQKVTGHKSLTMTKHYAHFDSQDFTEVIDFQNNLLRMASVAAP